MFHVCPVCGEIMSGGIKTRGVEQKNKYSLDAGVESVDAFTFEGIFP